MKIGWFVGNHNWTYNNLAESLINEMKKDKHLINERGGVTIILSVDQLHRFGKIEKDKNK